MSQVNIKKDPHDTDMAQVYVPIHPGPRGGRARWICCCSMHVDAIFDVFGGEASEALEDQGMVDVNISAEIQ